MNDHALPITRLKFCSAARALKKIALALVSTAALCATTAHAQTVTVSAELVAIPDSPAREKFNALPKDVVKEIALETRKIARADALKTPASIAEASTRPAAENLQKLDEIRVFGRVDPEDYVAPKRPPMLVFRATLDAQRPATPAEIACGLMAIVGLCWHYDRDGAILGPDPAARAEDRKNNTSLGNSRTRGTLQ